MKVKIVLSRIGVFLARLWGVILWPALKISKPRLRRKAVDVIIPLLKEKVNAGAVDKAVDAVIERTVLEAIDQI